ncbi:COG1470 family protein [Legionella jordanis]|uniref:NHL repeat protein n=1 Tax=Legionella jordanis TaxID=456 RepID=A0A0W0VFR8_9GAMM|nr:hypothetical protein [Legionella jordanis]KTD19013.1 NHL repeat protein [Legionella jordanis]RMX05426.1 DUF1566 domain-containing protein [Legionella jordanis]VEH13115.1 NHL repeat protein [Legionella jordanis]
MKELLSRLLVCVSALILCSKMFAGTPLWTFSPLTATTVSVSPSGTALIQYLITNQSRKTHTLSMTPIPGVNPILSGANGCPNPFILGYQQSCVLTLQVVGSTLQGNVVGGPKVCSQGNPLQCYQPSPGQTLNIRLQPAPSETVLSSSVSNLALTVNGKARTITITNAGAEAATGVTYTASALPAGTTITPTSCGTILPGGSCQLTITPAATPSAAPGDVNATPIRLSIRGDNSNTLVVNVNVLTYGSVYQSGFLFAIDDSTPGSTSISGKVAALVDQASFATGGKIWSSDSSGNPVFDVVPGIYQPAVPPNNCAANIDGACNTSVIVAYYSARITNPSIDLSLYAAGLCRLPIAGYNDWYLPAICEMGYDRTNQGTGCGTQASPTLQNMQSNLVENGNVGGLFLAYWSSTESSIIIPTNAWNQFFSPGPPFPLAFQDEDSKDELIAVRCVRAITP